MLENEGNGLFGDGGLDLGNGFTDLFGNDDPFGGGEPALHPKSEPADETALDGILQAEPSVQPAEEPLQAEPETENLMKEPEANGIGPQSGVQQGAPSEKDAGTGTEIPYQDTANLFDAAIAQAEEKQAAALKSSLADKLPVFVYANAKEELADTSKTFDQLRYEKSEDFPEMDDGSAVSWKMVYGSVTKAVSTPKKTTIAELKKQIEDSKAFKDALKKAKGEITCEVRPSVTAKKKGIASSYKGIFPTVADAEGSGKTICYVPAEDGRVYEVRPNKIGTFIAPADKVTLLSKVRAGFIPALPKIPYQTLAEVLSFFKLFVNEKHTVEAMVYIYWSVADEKYYVYAPVQQVSKERIDTTLPELDEEKFVLVMEVHSHNTMKAFFSPTDDKDERATRLYTVVGRLDKLFPEIKTRASVGGTFIPVCPADVFEGIAVDFPESWSQAVQIAPPKKEGACEAE